MPDATRTPTEVDKSVDQQIETATEDISRGIDLLEATYGKDWSEHVDRDELDIGLCNYCVLGQIEGHVEDGVEKISEVTGESEDFIESRCGFFPNWDRYRTGVLEACWDTRLWRERTLAAA